MPSPILPNQILETVASLDGDFCEKFVASLQAPALFAAWYKTVFLADGTLTDEFKAMVCLATAGTGGDAVTPPVVPPAVDPPVDPEIPAALQIQPVYLIASTSGLSTINLTWTGTNATHYHLKRQGQTIAILPSNVRSYTDRVGQSRSYIYTVVAVNETLGLSSQPSNQALGYTRNGLIPGGA